MISVLIALALMTMSLGNSERDSTGHVVVINEATWNEYYVDAYNEYADEFTALFNSYETKRASNGALLIRTGNSGRYKFAKKGNVMGRVNWVLVSDTNGRVYCETLEEVQNARRNYGGLVLNMNNQRDREYLRTSLIYG